MLERCVTQTSFVRSSQQRLQISEIDLEGLCVDRAGLEGDAALLQHQPWPGIGLMVEIVRMISSPGESWLAVVVANNRRTIFDGPSTTSSGRTTPITRAIVVFDTRRQLVAYSEIA